MPVARRAVERATGGQQRIISTVRDTVDTVRDSVAPVVGHRPVRLFRHTISKAWSDRVLGLSAEAAFWQLLSLPPLLLALLGSLGYISALFGAGTITSVRNQLLRWAGNALTPETVNTIVAPTVDNVLHHGRADMISIGFVLSLWAGSSAMATFVNTITIAYDMRDLRGALRSRLIALWLYVVSMVVMVFLLPVMVLGPAKLVSLFPSGQQPDVSSLIHNAYWPTVAMLVLLALTSLYHLVVPQRLSWHRNLPGAIFASGVLVLGSYLLRLYFALVTYHSYSYGALASPIAILLYLFLLALAILLGAEFNATWEKIWPSSAPRRAGWRTVNRHRGWACAQPPDGIDS